MSFDLKCKKCREFLWTSKSEQEGCERCIGGTHVFMGIDDAPSWIKLALEEGGFAKDKLYCPKCKSKVGSYDFTSPSKCDCGAEHGSVWLISSKVDAVHQSLVHLRGTERQVSTSRPPMTKPNLTDQCNTSDVVCSDSELNALLNENANTNEDCGASASDARSELNAKVSEVARSLTQHVTRRGRECVANFCARLPSDVYPNVMMGHRSLTQRETPATTDDETEHSMISDLAAQGIQPLIQAALGDTLFAPPSEDDVSRDSSPSKEIEPQIIPADEITQNLPENENDAQFASADAYTCSVCLEIYYQPQQVDPCGHVFCDPCLRQVNGSNTSGADIKCPLCRKVIKKCNSLSDFWKDVKTFFPQEYQERHKVERKKRKNRPSLPGISPGRNAAARRGNRGGGNVLAMWAGVCFVILFMMLGFTVFATTIGFVAWYFLELAMDMTVDLVLELQSFSELFKTSIVVFCIDGGLSQDKWNQLYDSASRVFGAFTKLVHTRNESEVGIPEWLMSSYRGVADSYRGEAATKAYQMLWKVTQTNIANYVVFGCLVTFIMYRLAKYMQARRA